MEEKTVQPTQMVSQMQRNGLSNLARAYVAAWGEIGAGVVKDANNSHFGNDYATLEAVLKVAKPVLAKHKLAFLQSPGELVGDRIEVIGLLIHESGEQVVCKTAMPYGGKATAQAVGSATTYARRYQLMAVFGLAPVDDDGEAASSPTPAPTRKKSKKKADDESYAERKSALEDAISSATSVDKLEKEIRPLVEELADGDLNAVYIEKRRQLKAAAKTAVK